MQSLTTSYELETLDSLYAVLLDRVRSHDARQEDAMPDDPADNTRAVKTHVAGLVAAYPRASIEQATVSVYTRALSDLPAQALERAIKAWVMQSPFFPSVAELRATVIEERIGLPDAIVAWAMVGDAITAGDVTTLPAEVRHALKLVGGTWAYKNTQRPELLRRDFTQAYELIRSTVIRNANLSSAGLPMPTSLELTGGDDDAR